MSHLKKFPIILKPRPKVIETGSVLKVEGCHIASSMRREWKKLQMVTEFLGR